MMKKIWIFLMAFALMSCHDNDSVAEEQGSVLVPETKAIKVDLQTLIEAFDWKNDRQYEMNQKYVGKKLTVTGRTSGVSENGELVMQVRPTGETVTCIGISDRDFLMSIKKDDDVEITGIFQREHVGTLLEGSILENCSNWKITSKNKR